MILVGMDPSLKRTGISVLDSEKKVIYIKKFEFKEAMRNLSFNGVLERAIVIRKSLIDTLKGIGRVDKIISEIPPPSARFSAGLSLLDGVLIDRVLDEFACEVYFVGSGYLTYLHKTRKYTKDDSKDLAIKIAEQYQAEQYEIELKGIRYKDLPKISHDEAESFIFLSRLVCREKMLGLYDKIEAVNDRFADKKETSLLI